MKIVILQPSYIPWRGYFHQIQKADVFMFYDDVQYDKDGWRNRNRVKTPGGVKWLTIPVRTRGSVIQKTPINEMRISWDRPWNEKHWATIRQAYARAPYFGQYAPLLESFYARHDELLSDLVIDLTIALSRELGITHARFMRSSEIPVPGAKTDRLLAYLAALGADHYISGPSARAYIDEDKVRAARVTLEYMTYDYPKYEQLYPPYDPQVSIIDLLFMKGPAAGEYIWGSGAGEGGA